MRERTIDLNNKPKVLRISLHVTIYGICRLYLTDFHHLIQTAIQRLSAFWLLLSTIAIGALHLITCRAYLICLFRS